jgi:hypothetical protein
LSFPRSRGRDEAGSAVLALCRSVRTFAPWAIDGPFDLAASADEAVVASGVPNSLPRFAMTENNAPVFSPWEDARFSGFVKAVSGLGCVGATRGHLAGGVVSHEKAGGGVFALVDLRDAPSDHDAANFAATSLPHRAEVLRCAHTEDATLFASLGEDRPIPGFPPIPGQLRLLVEGDGPSFRTSVTAISGLVEYAVAMNPDLVSVALARDDDFFLGVATPRELRLELVPVAHEKVEHPSVAIAQNRIHLAWRPRDASVLRWASMDPNGNHRLRGDLATADEAVSGFALATRGERLVLAYARARGQSVELLVGEGPTLPDAADHAAVVARAGSVASVHLASGDAPWLAWVEEEPDGRRNAHVVALSCP